MAAHGPSSHKGWPHSFDPPCVHHPYTCMTMNDERPCGRSVTLLPAAVAGRCLVVCGCVFVQYTHTRSQQCQLRPVVWGVLAGLVQQQQQRAPCASRRQVQRSCHRSWAHCLCGKPLFGIGRGSGVAIGRWQHHTRGTAQHTLWQRRRDWGTLHACSPAMQPGPASASPLQISHTAVCKTPACHLERSLTNWQLSPGSWKFA